MRTPLHPTANALVVGVVCLFISLMLPCCYPAGTRPASDSGVTDSDTDTDTDTGPEWGISHIWIANSYDNTLSKVNTQTAVEVARYRTCPSSCDPSRTSVNLHGDAVVTNRDSSSVTKFAAAMNDCVDNNDNGTIETSNGPTDVLDWGKDECMLWHTELPLYHGARATAWDGKEDPDTGLGGNVWIGTCGGDIPQMVYKLDGDNGAIVGQIDVDAGCCYGGAVDGNDGFWVYNAGIFGPPSVFRVEMSTLQVSETVQLGGYGITVDSQGRVWVGNGYFIFRYDPADGSLDECLVADAYDFRGIAVGTEKSAGYVWVADFNGTLHKIDQENMAVAGAYDMGIKLVGVAVDFEGYVWAVDLEADAAYKFDPDTETYVTVPVGVSPYTYSDMTGMQLKGVIIPE